MPLVSLNWKPGPRELRMFGAIFLTGFVLIGAVKYFWPFDRIISQDQTLGLWLAGIGVVVGGIALTGMKIALPLYWAWIGIAYVLGNVMSRVIITLIYFLLFTPMRLFGDLIGRDKLQLKQPKGDSYWLPISLPDEAERYERQY